jgi:hypothetical protein
LCSLGPWGLPVTVLAAIAAVVAAMRMLAAMLWPAVIAPGRMVRSRTRRWFANPPLTINKLTPNAEPYGDQDQQTANDVVHGGALTQKQNGKYHD